MQYVITLFLTRSVADSALSCDDFTRDVPCFVGTVCQFAPKFCCGEFLGFAGKAECKQNPEFETGFWSLEESSSPDWNSFCESCVPKEAQRLDEGEDPVEEVEALIDFIERTVTSAYELWEMELSAPDFDRVQEYDLLSFLDEQTRMEEGIVIDDGLPNEFQAKLWSVAHGEMMAKGYKEISREEYDAYMIDELLPRLVSDNEILSLLETLPKEARRIDQDPVEEVEALIDFIERTVSSAYELWEKELSDRGLFLHEEGTRSEDIVLDDGLLNELQVKGWAVAHDEAMAKGYKPISSEEFNAYMMNELLPSLLEALPKEARRLDQDHLLAPVY